MKYMYWFLQWIVLLSSNYAIDTETIFWVVLTWNSRALFAVFGNSDLHRVLLNSRGWELKDWELCIEGTSLMVERNLSLTFVHSVHFAHKLSNLENFNFLPSSQHFRWCLLCPYMKHLWQYLDLTLNNPPHGSHSWKFELSFGGPQANQLSSGTF